MPTCLHFGILERVSIYCRYRGDPTHIVTITVAEIASNKQKNERYCIMKIYEAPQILLYIKEHTMVPTIEC